MSSLHPRQGTSRTTRCVSESLAGGERGRQAAGTPQLVALTHRAGRTRLECRAGSVTAGQGCFPEALHQLRKTVSPHSGKKLEGISAATTSHPKPDSNFPLRVGGCTAQSDPAEAARTRVPRSPGRGRQRPITERLGKERLEGAGSRRATAPMANREPRWESSSTPLTNGKGAALAEVPHPVAAGSRVAAGRRP